MLSSIFLASAFAASGAFAAISQGSWAVRADFSRCNSSTPLEPVLDGAKSTYSTTDKIVDFNIDSPFQGNLVIKVAGAAGYGSPYPPQQVAVEVFAEATGGDPGVWANATVIPGMGQPALISGIYWNTRSDITLTPASNETVSVETIFDGGSLVVFYCGLPDGPTPLSKRKHFLEVYDDLRYHEYETVSYTWGGENGDSRLNQPIYIGPYWDILLQTRNCWEMLRHMRPWKGVRTIWVDAICINQTDMQERQEQVAKMGRIYEKASRVVIYLGPDLVPPTSTSSLYPRRHNLREFDTLPERPQLPSDYLIPSKQWKLSDVFSREYFRRLWIIQELIMSSNITVRIGDTEFIVDHTVSSYAAHACHIPWFAFITRKSIGDQSGNNLRAAVEFVDASRASDPRDKIFGILGLIDSEEHQIAANYSISFRHLAIGYYAYCMLTKRDIRVLLHASGRRAPEGIPSWVPPAQYDVSRTINNGVVFLQVFQSILDAEKSGSSVDFFNVYFQAVREYHPQLIQWKSRRRDSDDDEDKIIDLVQLRFEPNQYDILEGILDMIQEDVKKSKEWSAQWPPPPPIHGGKDFNPPFLRIGWRDLALSQTNEASENPSANDEDVYGFYALDAINKAVDKERLLYDRAETEALSGHALDWSDEAVDEDPVDGGSHCQNSNGWLYDDSVVREHKGQDLWVAFDILSLTLWAQIHPNMAELRGLSRFCKDGENEMTRLLRPQTEEEHRLTCLNWPVGIMEDFKIDGELRHITII
ncbi:Heterokaryon incompatibility protein 6, OR allele [Colletotrichum fructicola]|nr:Heterokaryon incompatibility protein 6, OR allele [Colletotrichum fructicola]